MFEYAPLAERVHRNPPYCITVGGDIGYALEKNNFGRPIYNKLPKVSNRPITNLVDTRLLHAPPRK